MDFQPVSTKSPLAVILAFFLGLQVALPFAVESANLIWTGDFETGDFSQYKNHMYGEGEYTTKKLITSPTRDGRYAAEFTILGNQYPNKERVEMIARDGSVVKYKWETKTQTGPEYWVGFSFMIPKEGLGDAWTYFQIHGPGRNQNVRYPDCFSGSGNILIWGDKEIGGVDQELSLIVTEQGGQVRTGANGNGIRVWSEKLQTDVWHDFVIHFKLSMLGNGFFEVWKNGQKIYEKFNLTNVDVRDSCGYPQDEVIPSDQLHHHGPYVGIYAKNQPQFRQIYYDEVRVAQGSGADGYDLVAPRGSGASQNVVVSPPPAPTNLQLRKE